MAIDLELMRRYSWPALRVMARRRPEDFPQMADLERAVLDIHWEASSPGQPKPRDYGYSLEEKDNHNLRVVVSELITQGVLVAGYPGNTTLPHFQITDYGIRCLETQSIEPYDQDGYLAQIRADQPTLDAVAARYIQESLECLRRQCPMASVIMLGGAAEKVFLLLIESMGAAIGDPARRARYEKQVLHAWGLKSKFDGFRKEMDSVVKVPEFPRDLAEDLDVQLMGIFSLVRRSRNDFGHPSGKSVSQEDARANLILFRGFCKLAYDLMAFFAGNKL